MLKWMSMMNVEVFSFTNTFWHQTNKPSINDVDISTLDCIRDYDSVIALGGFVSSVLDKAGIEHFKMPHPSPRNRVLNDKDLEKKLIEDCNKYIHK